MPTRPSPLALACPDSLKGVLDAAGAAAALARGFRRAGVEAEELPLADGGEGTMAALHGSLGGVWHTAQVSDPLGRTVQARLLALPDGTVVVESAEAIGLTHLAPEERNPLVASSRGLGELVLAALALAPRRLLVTLGGSATVDGGVGLREVLARVPVPVAVACDVRNPLLGERGAARIFGPQKGATPEMVDELERRLAALPELRPYAELPGAGAAGGLGAALAALGGELVPGAELVLETVRFRERAAGAALVVTGEGAVDRSTPEGKTPAAVVAACGELGVRCAVFGGLVLERPAGWDVHALSGEPAHAVEDLERLGEELGRTLLEAA